MSSMLGDQEASYVGHPGATDMNAVDPSRRTGGGALPGAPAYDQPPRRNSGMQGFGNPNMPDARGDKSWIDKISSAAAAAVNQYSSNAENRVHFASEGVDYNTYSTNRGTNPATKAVPYNPNSYAVGAAPSVWGTSAPQQAPTPVVGGIVPDIPIRPGLSGRVGGGAVDGTYEQGLVASLCEPGGMKAVPPEDKLKAFLESAPTLSPDLIGACLEAQLNEDAWQSRVKALIVIASLAANRSCLEHAQWWKAEERQAELVSIAQQDSKASVRAQASKTCQSLGIHASGTAEHQAPAHAAHHTAAATSQPSLLLDDFDPAPAVPTQHYPVTAPVQEMGLGYPAPPVPAAAPEDDGGLFSGMDLASNAQTYPAAPAHAAPIDQFSGLTLQPTPVATNPGVPAPTPAPAAPSSGFDAFSLIEPEPLVPAAPPASVSKGGIDLSDLDPTFNKNNASAGVPTSPQQGYPQGFPVVGGAAYGAMPGQQMMGGGVAYAGQVPVQSIMSRPMPGGMPIMPRGPPGPYYGVAPVPGAYPVSHSRPVIPHMYPNPNYRFFLFAL
jgi:hypothetical protein